MTNLSKYFKYLSILNKSNKQLDLDNVDVLLLDTIAKANDAGRILNVKDLLPLKEIASQATIHGRLKHLVNTKLITLKSNKDDGRLREVVLTKLAHKRYEILSKAIEG
jgi:DNA-binding MarR family transcriptional regulator